jgi:hypothetical protein
MSYASVGVCKVTEAFEVIHRSDGSWDIAVLHRGRVFRVYGHPGRYFVLDERWDAPFVAKRFKKLTACMAFICGELMLESEA